jgi:hypothetical protein
VDYGRSGGFRLPQSHDSRGNALDPTKLLVNGKSGETMNLSCGSQKPVQIRIEYDPPGLNRPGIDGVVRVIRFDQ